MIQQRGREGKEQERQRQHQNQAHTEQRKQRPACPHQAQGGGQAGEDHSHPGQHLGVDVAKGEGAVHAIRTHRSKSRSSP